jgi:serine phosphatase RsbU (regulator of sigma subunit)
VEGRFFGLRWRLLALVAILLAAWLALVLYAQRDERAAAIDAVHREETLLLRIVTSNQAAQVEAGRQMLEAIARAPALATHDVRGCNAFLAQMLKASPMYVNIGVAGRDGKLWCSAVPLTATVDVTDRSYFRRAMATQRFAVGTYQVGRVTLTPAVNYALPIVGTGGEVESVAYVAQSLNWLTLALAKTEFPAGAVLVVTDADDIVLARIPDAENFAGKPLPEAGVRAAISGLPAGGVFEASDAAGVQRLWATTSVADLGFNVTIGVPRATAFAGIDRRLREHLVVLGVATALALLAAWLGGGYILRQVDALVAASKRLGAGDLAARASVIGDRSELEYLARTFNDMSAALEARERELRVAEAAKRAAEVEIAVTHAHMQIAEQIQQSLLPQSPLAMAGMQVAGRCIPVESVGGDYFGYFPRKRGGVDSFVGDVSGHGVGAALLMAEARITFLTERLAEPGAARMLAKLNEVLHDDLDHAGHFITACCATFDPATRELRYANGGHPPALLLRAGEQACRTLDAEGLLLGLEKDAKFAEVTVKLAAGDMVVMYTDGVTETRNAAGAAFGRDRLEQGILAHRLVDAETAIDELFADLARFAGETPRDDDVTIVIMKALA